MALRDVCGIQDWLQAGPAGTFLLTLWDCDSRVRHRPPGLHGTLWDTGPAAGTWASPPDLRPSNKPSRQICSDKTRKFAYWRYTGLAKKFGFFHGITWMNFLANPVLLTAGQAAFPHSFLLLVLIWNAYPPLVNIIKPPLGRRDSQNYKKGTFRFTWKDLNKLSPNNITSPGHRWFIGPKHPSLSKHLSCLLPVSSVTK